MNASGRPILINAWGDEILPPAPARSIPWKNVLIALLVAAGWALPLF